MAHAARRGEYKQRITVSLTKDAVAFLKSYRAQVRAPSLSALVEEMITDLQRREEREALDRSVTAYYDSLSAEQVRDEAAWGELGESGLAQT